MYQILIVIVNTIKKKDKQQPFRKAPYSSFYLYYTQFILFYTIIFAFLEILGITQSLFHLKSLIKKVSIHLPFKSREIGLELKKYPFFVIITFGGTNSLEYETIYYNYLTFIFKTNFKLAESRQFKFFITNSL